MTIDRLRAAVAAVIAQQPALTASFIRETIELVRPLHPSLHDDEAESLAREFEAIHQIILDVGDTLLGQEFRPWLADAKEKIDPYYWNRYRTLLVEGGMPRGVIASTDTISDEILGLLGNPSERDPWDRRGLVVGHVQSGKTANYIALCCKAADAGYRVIIIIAGIHNRLRRQTQIRVDQGFLGRDTSRGGSRAAMVGVGRIDSRRLPNSFTNATTDFDKGSAGAAKIPLRNLTEPAVFVIKKNPHTLGNLLTWLKTNNRRHDIAKITEPMLLIDDEADNASINIRYGADGVSRINSQIRDLLSVFNRSCYVGYTATPFANIFIEPSTEDEMFDHDLFPRDFIKNLDAPSNYYGPGRVFTQDTSHSPIRHIADNQDVLPIPHRKAHEVSTLPHSLLEATRTFLLACTVRRLRQHQRAHKSMLVNASQFNPVQRQLRLLLHDYLDQVKRSVRIHGMKPPDAADRSDEIRSLRLTFEREYSASGCQWPQVLRELHAAISPVEVVEVNSGSSTSLDYAAHSDGLNVIAVGGYSLSRGLTLHGLIVSYFLRNARAYDTLMQMGRWFGYRDDYEDLCRVWMLPSAEDWYSHISDSFEELRADLRSMSRIGAAPKDFGLRVRSHPDSLMVTARNKMGTGQLLRRAIGLANRFVETAFLARSEAKQQANRQAARRLIRHLPDDGFGLDSATKSSGSYLFTGVPFEPILDFLSDFENDPRSICTDPGPICEYIQKRADELQEWDLYVPGVERREKLTLVDDSLGFPVHCQRRAQGKRFREDRHTLMVTNKQRVASRGVEKVGLPPEAIREAERRFRERSGHTNYPDSIYRALRLRPLLILHLLAIGEKGQDLSGNPPVVAYSISFPDTTSPEDTVDYVFNTTMLRQLGFGGDDEEDISSDD